MRSDPLRPWPARPWWRRFQCEIPDGASGGWSVETHDHSQRTKAEMRAMQAEMSGVRAFGRLVPPGRYTVLKAPGAQADPSDPYAGEMRGCGTQVCMMSDTPPEIRDAIPFMRAARGHVLILGLGLGIVPRALLLFCPRVERIVVVERSRDVLRLVEPALRRSLGLASPRLEIVEDDAFNCRPPAGTRFDCAWSDVWPTIDVGNLPQMDVLRRRFAPFVDGPHFAWAEREALLTRAMKRGETAGGRSRRQVLATLEARLRKRTWGASIGARRTRCRT